MAIERSFCRWSGWPPRWTQNSSEKTTGGAEGQLSGTTGQKKERGDDASSKSEAARNTLPLVQCRARRRSRREAPSIAPL